MSYRQDSPFCLHLELAEGCSLHCAFCGLTSIQKKGDMKAVKRMTFDNAKKLAKVIRHTIKEHGWNPRLEWAAHGEPSLNQEMLEIMRMFRAKLPNQYMIMESNGAGFLRDPTESIDSLIDAGLNVLAFDNYEYVRTVPKILEKYKGK